MGDRSLRTPVVAAIGVLLLAVVLVAAGLFVRNVVAGSLAAADNVRAVRSDGLYVVKAQLDEETGVRGFALTHNASFLEPFYGARDKLPKMFEDLQEKIARMGSGNAASALKMAHDVNTEWIATVANPAIAGQDAAGHGIQVHGKTLVDSFRVDMTRFDGALEKRENEIDAEAQASVSRIFWLVVGAAMVIFVLGGIFLAYQRRLSRAIEQAHDRAEEARRRGAELAAAYRAEKRIADSLQEALAQAPLPNVEALRFSAVYVPAEEEAKVGGDWYDAVELSEGRVLFVIGDVAGHGIEAAVTMSRARQALISSALGDVEPGRVLERANAALFLQDTPMVTSVVGYADARTFTFTFASAGHPPPLLIEPGRTPRLLPCGSVPLGALEGATYKTERIQSVPGALLVLYTDGVVEHSRDVLAGEAMLVDVAGRVAKDAYGNPASEIRDAIFSEHAVADDVAIMTISFSEETSTGLAISADAAHGTVGRQPAFSAGRRTSPSRGSRGPRGWLRALLRRERGFV